MTKKLQLVLDEEEARVLAAALGLLPLVCDAEAQQKVVSVLTEPDQRALVALTGAMMMGAEKMSDLQKGIDDKVLLQNMQRAARLMMVMSDFIMDDAEDAPNAGN